MEMQGNQLPIIEIKPVDVSLEDRNQEVKYPIEITPEHDEDEISVKPDFQVHVSVQDDQITDARPEIYSPIEVKTEYEWLKTDTDTEVNTEYEQSTKAEIEEVQSTKSEYNQAETDQSRSDRMSLGETELNQNQEEVHVSQQLGVCVFKDKIFTHFFKYKMK